MTETGKVFLRYLYKRFGWKVIHHRKKLFRIIHKRAFETSMKKLKFVIFTNAPCKGLNSNTYTSLNDRNRMIGIVINRKQEYNISVKQYLSESNNLNGDKKWITENSANAIT